MTKLEIKLAKAIKIEKDKQYIVIFESDRESGATDVDDIKAQINKIFKDFGAKVRPVVVTDGRIKIAEVISG